MMSAKDRAAGTLSGEITMTNDFKWKFAKRCATATAAILLAAGMARADVLELRTGEIIQGKFLGGSPLNIRFEVQGQERVFSTKDVLNLGFADTSVSSATSAPPPAPPAPSASAQPTSAPPPAPPSAPSSLTATTASAAPSASQASASPQTSQAITIPSGTDVIVRMIDTVDSSTNKVGDTFHASLESPI